MPTRVARARSGAVAVGDASGVTWIPEPTPGVPRRRATLPAVNDLVFVADVLWIGTEDGLFRWAEAGRPERRPLRGGEHARGIARLAVADGALVVASDAGAYWSTTGEIFQPLMATPVGTPVSRIAVRALGQADATEGSTRAGSDDAIREIWLLDARELSRIRGLATANGLRVLERRAIRLPRPDSARSVVELAFDPSGAMLLLGFPDSLARRLTTDRADPGASPRTLLSDEAARLRVPTNDGVRTLDPIAAREWEIFRPVLAPGAAIRAIAWGEAGRLALATDHGVFFGAGPAGPFERSPDPVGSSDCQDVDGTRADEWVALCRAGVFSFSPVATTRPLAESNGTRRASTDRLPPDPPLAEIRHHALVESGLTASRATRLWRGLRRRGLWPEVSLRVGVDVDRDESRDADQSFVSGDTRQLFDLQRNRGEGYDASLILEWDLAELAYPEDSVDLSRELRQVISLRDDVLDEINQLYFERQRLREALGRRVSSGGEEAGRQLVWRAREIDAGLDAWTGGWITRWRRARAREIESGSTPDPGPEPPIERDR